MKEYVAVRRIRISQVKDENERFSIFDANKDEYIDAEEYRDLVSSIGKEKKKKKKEN